MAGVEGAGGLDFVLVIVVFVGIHLWSCVSQFHRRTERRKGAVRQYIPAHTAQP